MFSKLITKFRADDSGVSLVEYCLIAALVAVGAITALGTIGTNLTDTLDTISNDIGAAG